jgi:hypothetical protein
MSRQGSDRHRDVSLIELKFISPVTANSADSQFAFLVASQGSVCHS